MALGNNANMSATEQVIQAKKFRLSVKLTAAVLIIAAAAGLFEAFARVVFAYREDIQASPLLSGIFQRSLVLDPYEMVSPLSGHHWVLRTGYNATRKELIAQKKNSGRNLGAAAIQAGINSQGGNGKNDFRINADGFKGPELDNSHSRRRILALGDSTTFGIGSHDYPRRLEDNLNQRGGSFEVINGGVEGYSPSNVLYEIKRYKALKPEIVTLYIGWNSLFSSSPWKDAWENRLRVVWLFKSANTISQVFAGGRKAYALKMYKRVLKPIPNSPEVKALETYRPLSMDKIEKIVDELESAGSRVVLITLPGLFMSSVKPTPKALKIGHLPYFTENPYVLAKLTERFNIALRGLADRRGLGLIDLEKWSVQALRPREAFFSDSVHLTANGLDMIGAFIADQPENQLIRNR